MDNDFLYPFLGSRLQNRVVYVPVTADGSIVDYKDARTAQSQFDEHAWLQRLRDHHVEYLALLPPSPPEALVIARRPDVFRLVVQGACNDARLYRVDTTRL